MDNQVISITPPDTPWQDIEEYIPDGYSLDHTWLSYLKNDGTQEPISGPCWIRAYTCNKNKDEWGFIVHWLDIDGNEHFHAFPQRILHEQSNPIIGVLASRGLRINSNKKRRLIDYLSSFDLPHRARSVSKIGWHEETAISRLYVLPNEIIGSQGSEEVIFQPEAYSPTVESIHSKGRLEDWKAHVAEPCNDNSLLIFSLCSALSAPLIKPLGHEGGGFHIYGKSSKGKTTALQVAASVWGSGVDPSSSDDSFVQKWSTTGNASEAINMAHNDCLQVRDEIGTCDEKKFEKMIYDTFGGISKSRMDRSCALMKPKQWTAWLLSSGEISIRQKIEEISKKPMLDGLAVRLVDVPIGKSVISNPHAQPPAQFVNNLKKACGLSYGTAGPAFLRKLLAWENNCHLLSYRLEEKMKTAYAALTEDLPLEETQARVIQRFAIVAVAGELAYDFGITPFTPQEVLQAINLIQNRWLSEDSNKPEEIKGLIQLQEYIQANLSNFAPFDTTSEGMKYYRNLAGYTKTEAGEKLFLFPNETMRAACTGISQNQVLDELFRRGLLSTNEAGRKNRKHTVTSLGSKRFYTISSKLIELEL